MRILPSIRSELVYRGWWVNYTSPFHRKYMWTATNTESLVFLSAVGIVGTIAGDRLWVVLRYSLQPAVQLPDSSNRLQTLSRTEAIKELGIYLKDVKMELKAIWEEEQDNSAKIREFLAALKGESLRAGTLSNNAQEKVPIRFGISAILCVVSFALLGAFVPYLLGEGLQNNAVVTSKNILGAYLHSRVEIPIGETLLNRVSRDLFRCFNNRGQWIRTSYCIDLKNELPPYDKSEISLDTSQLSNAKYQLLRKYGDRDFGALKFSRYTTFQDVGFNSKLDGDVLRHEFTCSPISLETLITHNESGYIFEAGPLWAPQRLQDIVGNASVVMCDSTALITSNAPGSGRDIYAKRTDPVYDNDTKEATNADVCEQETVDSALPALKLDQSRPKIYYSDQLARKGSYMVRRDYGAGSRLRNFLITFKAGMWYVQPKVPWDDPIFPAHTRNSSGYFADRELTALGCVELFSRCPPSCLGQEQCSCAEASIESNPSLRISDPFRDTDYLSIMSIWLNTLLEASYGFVPGFDNTGKFIRKFFDETMDPRNRWKHDLEERFIRSMLRTRHAYKMAAEMDQREPMEGYATYDIQLLYLSPDSTNINIWGTVCTLCAYLNIIGGSRWPNLLLPVVFFVKLLLHGMKLIGTAGSSFIDLWKRSITLLRKGGNVRARLRRTVIMRRNLQRHHSTGSVHTIHNLPRPENPSDNSERNGLPADPSSSG